MRRSIRKSAASSSEAVRVFETDLGCTVERAHPGWEDPFPHFWTIVAGDTDLTGMRRMMKGAKRKCRRTSSACCSGNGRRKNSPTPR